LCMVGAPPPSLSSVLSTVVVFAPRSSCSHSRALAWPVAASCRRAAPPLHHRRRRARIGAPAAHPSSALDSHRCGEYSGAHPEAGDLTDGELLPLVISPLSGE
jgi:hypothetical protein